MKYCYTCKRYFTDEFHFCTQCGKSFTVRFCRSGRHLNPIDAHYCRECGSSDLSNPDKEPPDSTPAKVFLIAGSFAAAAVALIFVLLSLWATDGLPPPAIFFFMLGGAVVLVGWSSFRQSL